jgi:chemotaxis protein MotB
VRAPLLLALLVGCVSKGRHELAVVQLQATQAALSARTGECAEDAATAEAERRVLVSEIARRQLQLDELTARARLRDEALEGTQAQQVALLAELAGLRTELTALRTAWSGRGAPPPSTPTPATDASQGSTLAAVEAHFREVMDERRAAEARAADTVAFGALVAADRVELDVRGGSTVVRIPTALLFQEGFSTLSARGRELAGQLAAALRQVPGRRVTIEGHTDARPIHTAEYPSNWERGFGQSMALLRALEAEDAPVTLSAASFAGTRPLGDDEAGNRRLELLVALDPDLPTAYPPSP